MADEVLVVDQLVKRYPSPGGDHEVLQGVSLRVQPGETVGIVGASGSGKSTLLNIIGSLDKPTSGTVTLGDRDVAALQGDDLARYRSRFVGFVFQDHHLLPQCTAVENVALPALALKDAAAGVARARELLDRVGLEGRGEDFPRTLSGGERQRVAIARALVNQPPLVLCDEPTGNLDRETGRRVASLFAELAREHGAMMVVATHNLELTRFFKRCLALRDGMLSPLEESAD